MSRILDFKVSQCQEFRFSKFRDSLRARVPRRARVLRRARVPGGPRSPLGPGPILQVCKQKYKSRHLKYKSRHLKYTSRDPKNKFRPYIYIYVGYFTKKHFFPKMFLLVGKMFPHPVGVFCTHLEPPNSHIRKKICVPKFIYLLYCFL